MWSGGRVVIKISPSPSHLALQYSIDIIETKSNPIQTKAKAKTQSKQNKMAKLNLKNKSIVFLVVSMYVIQRMQLRNCQHLTLSMMYYYETFINLFQSLSFLPFHLILQLILN